MHFQKKQSWGGELWKALGPPPIGTNCPASFPQSWSLISSFPRARKARRVTVASKDCQENQAEMYVVGDPLPRPQNARL